MSITRDPEVLPVAPRGDREDGHYWPIPWHPQPSFFAAIEVDIVDADGKGYTITHLDVEAMLATDRSHRGFMARQKFPVASLDTPLSFDDWLGWQRFRDPIHEDPARAKEIRERFEEDRRGPGISRRTGTKKPARPRPKARKVPPAKEVSDG